MRPERRFKPGMDGGLTAAFLVSPPHHLRTDEILSKRWGPPQDFNASNILVSITRRPVSQIESTAANSVKDADPVCVLNPNPVQQDGENGGGIRAGCSLIENVSPEFFEGLEPLS